MNLQKLATVAVPLVVISLAAAGPAQGISGSCANSPNGGYGTLNVSVGWTAVRKFNYNGIVRDRCNAQGQGDGLGAEFLFLVVATGGTQGQTSVRGRDDDGCNNNTPGAFTDSVSWPQPVRETAPIIRQVDNGNPLVGCVLSSSDNPYT